MAFKPRFTPLRSINAPCCWNHFQRSLVLGDGSDPPPALSDYCVQWSTFAASPVFPCGDAPDINGNTNFGELCGGDFNIVDFGDTGNLFTYKYLNSNLLYAQVVRPIANAALADLGYYAFEFGGNPLGPFPISADNENCYIGCYQATFSVDDVNTDGVTAFGYNSLDMTIDLQPGVLVPFSDPTHDAVILAQLQGFLEPSATFESTYVGNTVTITMRTIMTNLNGIWGTQVADIAPFTLTEITCP